MRRAAIGDMTKQRAYLEKRGIIIPPSDPAIGNLADYIQQPEVSRNKVRPSRRVAEVKKTQALWIGKRVVETKTGRQGVVKYLTVRRKLCYGQYSVNVGYSIYLARVDWDDGGFHAGLSVTELTVISAKPKPSTKAST